MSKLPESEALAQRLRALEASLLQPDVRKSDQRVALLAAEFIEFGSSGRTYTKQDLVAVLQAESPSIQTTSNFKVTRLAPTVALLTYLIRREASPPGYTLRSSVWQQRGADWQMVFHQATHTSAEQWPAWLRARPCDARR
jgi:hypothetical protein